MAAPWACGLLAWWLAPVALGWCLWLPAPQPAFRFLASTTGPLNPQPIRSLSDAFSLPSGRQTALAPIAFPLVFAVMGRFPFMPAQVSRFALGGFCLVRLTPWGSSQRSCDPSVYRLRAMRTCTRAYRRIPKCTVIQQVCALRRPFWTVRPVQTKRHVEHYGWINPKSKPTLGVFTKLLQL